MYDIKMQTQAIMKIFPDFKLLISVICLHPSGLKSPILYSLSLSLYIYIYIYKVSSSILKNIYIQAQY